MTPPEGQEEGDTCNREVIDHSSPDGSTTVRCQGTMEAPEVKNCTCFISPPCPEHSESRFVCSECEAEAGE